MKKFLLICLAVSTMTALRAEAFDWSVVSGFFANKTTATEKTAVDAKTETINALNNIQKQADELDSTVQKNCSSIISMLSAKKEAKSIESELNSILSNADKTAAEKEALYNQALNTYITNLSNNNSTITTLKKLSATQKMQLVKDITSIEQTSQKYAALAKEALKTSASNLLKTTSSSNATTEDIAEIITQTNQSIGLIKTKAANSLEVANQFATLAKSAGIIK
ncbi:hypothetical protein IKQ21_02610 [bacterium]|nr:hypothetical protein [bacterium]